MAQIKPWASDVSQVEPGARQGVRETAVGNIVILDAVLFFLFILDRVAVGPAPFGVVLGALIGFIGLTRRPRLRVWFHQLLIFGYIILLAYLATESSINGADWRQRLLRFGVLFVLLWVLADGRFDPRSAVVGMVTGMIVNAIAFYLRLTPNNYPPFLTGWLGDKNVAGLWYAVIGILGLLLLRRGPVMYAWIALFALLLFLTGSRTSMSAYGAALVWGVARGRLGPFGRVILAGVLYWVLNFLETTMARVGVFADREGTDWFRAMIDAQTAVKVAHTPWYGSGLGTAWVQLTAERWIWFHDSYAALRVEGGIPLLVVMLGFVVLVAGGLFGRDRSRESRISEMAIVVLLVCAWKLGEVFFTSIGFITLGIALYYRYGQPYETRPDAWADRTAPTQSATAARASFADRTAGSLTSDVAADSTFVDAPAKASPFSDGIASSAWDRVKKER